MDLERFLCEKKWSALLFSKICGVSHIIIYKLLHKQGGISLDNALLIEIASEGKVTPWDLSENAQAIRNKTFKKTKNEFNLRKKTKKEK